MVIALQKTQAEQLKEAMEDFTARLGRLWEGARIHRARVRNKAPRQFAHGVDKVEIKQRPYKLFSILNKSVEKLDEFSDQDLITWKIVTDGFGMQLFDDSILVREARNIAQILGEAGISYDRSHVHDYLIDKGVLWPETIAPILAQEREPEHKTYKPRNMGGRTVKTIGHAPIPSRDWMPDVEPPVEPTVKQIRDKNLLLALDNLIQKIAKFSKRTHIQKEIANFMAAKEGHNLVAGPEGLHTLLTRMRDALATGGELRDDAILGLKEVTVLARHFGENFTTHTRRNPTAGIYLINKAANRLSTMCDIELTATGIQVVDGKTPVSELKRGYAFLARHDIPIEHAAWVIAENARKLSPENPVLDTSWAAKHHPTKPLKPEQLLLINDDPRREPKKRHR